MNQYSIVPRSIALLCAAAILVALAACTSTPVSTPEGEEVSPTSAAEPTAAPTEVPPTEPPTEPPPTEVPPTEAPPTDTPEPTSLPALPAEPQRIEFEAEDGQPLVGTYYPGAINPADTVVLMHWAPGDQRAWVEIAKWLQNRGEAGASEGQAESPWLDPSWFPAVPDGLSFAVFTFDFRGCVGGCSEFAPDGWLLDAMAAMETVKGLPGVDPNRLVAIGASIGSDGAVDACGQGCLGALSISPGGYLTVPYADAAAALGEDPAKPAWCLAAESDRDSAAACRSASGDHYWMTIYPGAAHGMELVRPEVDPDTLVVILDFLALASGL